MDRRQKLSRAFHGYSCFAAPISVKECKNPCNFKATRSISLSNYGMTADYTLEMLASPINLLLIWVVYSYNYKWVNEMKWFLIGWFGRETMTAALKVPPELHVKGAEHPWKSAGAQHPWAALGSSWPWLDHTHNHTTGAAAQRNVLIETEDKLKGGNQRETIFRQRD